MTQTTNWLNLPLDQLKGVGPKTMLLFRQAGFTTVRDLIYYLPRDYQDQAALTTIANIRPGKVAIKGQIDSLRNRPTRRRNFMITEGVIRDQTGALKVIWFNQSYRAKQFDPKETYLFSGQYQFKYRRYQLISPSAIPIKQLEQGSGPLPIYAAKAGIKSQFFQKIIKNLRPSFSLIPDLLPKNCFPRELSELSRAEALFNLHFPSDLKKTRLSERYLAYEELFSLILAAKLSRQQLSQLRALSLPFIADNTKALVQSLPFKLTSAQKIATWSILQDLAKPKPMNRLLQGDVGSGKTVVAALAAAQAALSGHQTALMAPTAILAAQHYQSLTKLLIPLGIKTALLTGGTTKKSVLKAQIHQGEIDLVIGTQALLTDDTVFHSLALCIIDEQHRLGVGQRQKLLNKLSKAHQSYTPHLLSMTATPIPRSLQLTIFGDLDISVLNQLPSGRRPISTKILRQIDLLEQLYPKIKELISQGQQIYWVCPAVTETTKTSTSKKTTVEQQTTKLRQIFPKFRIEFLHGQLSSAKKEQIMEQFVQGEIDILVSTTVIEVGVNVPNANLIVIEQAENYGLAQLHQLRGRVGRGQNPGFCYLLIDSEKTPSPRLQELSRSTDGFHLSEVDLKLRGPGEIYGSLQHGALDLRIATLSDTKLVAEAAAQAEIFAKNRQFMLKYPELVSAVRKYQQLTILN